MLAADSMWLLSYWLQGGGMNYGLLVAERNMNIVGMGRLVFWHVLRNVLRKVLQKYHIV